MNISDFLANLAPAPADPFVNQEEHVAATRAPLRRLLGSVRVHQTPDGGRVHNWHDSTTYERDHRTVADDLWGTKAPPLHRTDGPAYIHVPGDLRPGACTIRWERHGYLCRFDGPAHVTATGHLVWHAGHGSQAFFITEGNEVHGPDSLVTVSACPKDTT